MERFLMLNVCNSSSFKTALSSISSKERNYYLLRLRMVGVMLNDLFVIYLN